MDNLCWEYILTGNFDDGLNYGTKSLELAHKLNFKRGIANANNDIGSIFLEQSNYPKALDSYLKALNISEELNDKKNMAKCFGNIGIVYMEQADYPKALTYYLKGLKITEELRDKNGTAIHLANIGVVYEEQDDYAKALDYYLKALKMAEELGDKITIAKNLGNIGNVYKNQTDYPKALDYDFKALKMAEELGNKNSIALYLGNIGNVYNQQAEASQKASIKGRAELQAKALTYYFKALKMAEEIEDKKGIARHLGNIGWHYIKTGKYKEAEVYLKRALAIDTAIGFRLHEENTYENLSILCDATGRYKLALEYYKKATQLNDTIYSTENKKQLIQKEMNFEFDKKEAVASATHKKELENQQAIAKQKSKQQKLVIAFICVGLLLVLIFAVFMFNRFRVTQKQKNIIQLKEQETQQQNLIISHQKHLVEEKHKEITDSINYAERIQRSFMATKELLDENLKEYFVFFQPKDVVSGDFYWASKLSNDCFALVTADSTGHGVPGAIMSLLNITSLEKAIENHVQPSDILNHTRKTIIERLKKDGSNEGGKDGMDCSLISFDFKNSKLTYAAANNPVWIARENNILEFGPDKMPVGKHERDSVSFTQHKVELQKGDVVYAITDGMPDQFGGPKGKKFMYKKLKELFISISNLPMNEQKAEISNSLIAWKGNMEQVDDVTVIGVRV